MGLNDLKSGESEPRALESLSYKNEGRDLKISRLVARRWARLWVLDALDLSAGLMMIFFVMAFALILEFGGIVWRMVFVK